MDTDTKWLGNKSNQNDWIILKLLFTINLTLLWFMVDIPRKKKLHRKINESNKEMRINLTFATSLNEQRTLPMSNLDVRNNVRLICQSVQNAHCTMRTRINAPLQSNSKPAHISIENVYDINVDDETARAQSAIPGQLTVHKSMFNKFQGFLFCNVIVVHSASRVQDRKH